MLFKKKNNNINHDFIVFDYEDNLTLKEAYVRLKDNVICYSIDNTKKVFQVESAVQGEGKTTVSTNLAVALGESEKKVLIVDLDFRRPRTHRSFKIPNVNGIGDYMIDKCSKEDLVKQTAYKNVDLVNRGCEISNASVVLTSNKLKTLLDDFRNEYDFIILDCPPVLMISDYIHIGKLSDGVIYVSAFAISKKKEVMEAIKQLRQNNINIIGSVFTHYDPKKSQSNVEYSYRYYEYGQNYSENNSEE